MTSIAERVANTDEQIRAGGKPPTMLTTTNEQIADRLWSESCQELRAEIPRLNAMLQRHQRALDECARYGRENRLKMDAVLERAFQEWQVQRQVELERAKKA